MHYSEKNLPFGGVGESGMGAYHGKKGKYIRSIKGLVGRRAIGRYPRGNLDAKTQNHAHLK